MRAISKLEAPDIGNEAILVADITSYKSSVNKNNLKCYQEL